MNPSVRASVGVTTDTYELLRRIFYVDLGGCAVVIRRRFNGVNGIGACWRLYSARAAAIRPTCLSPTSPAVLCWTVAAPPGGVYSVP